MDSLPWLCGAGEWVAVLPFLGSGLIAVFTVGSSFVSRRLLTELRPVGEGCRNVLLALDLYVYVSIGRETWASW